MLSVKLKGSVNTWDDWQLQHSVNNSYRRHVGDTLCLKNMSQL